MFKKTMLIEACKGQAERNKAVKARALSVLQEDLTVDELVFIASLLADIMVANKDNKVDELLHLIGVYYCDINVTYSLFDILMLIDGIDNVRASKVARTPVVKEVVNYFVSKGELVFINAETN